jgi:hypothetical protein
LRQLGQAVIESFSKLTRFEQASGIYMPTQRYLIVSPMAAARSRALEKFEIFVAIDRQLELRSSR